MAAIIYLFLVIVVITCWGWSQCDFACLRQAN